MPRTRLIIMQDKKADLAGPGISTYEEVEKVLPNDYNPILNKKETQQALYMIKRYIESNITKRTCSHVLLQAHIRSIHESIQLASKSATVIH